MKGSKFNLSRIIPLVVILAIFSPLHYITAGSPGSSFDEIREEELNSGGGFEFPMDEGKGQVLHDIDSEDPFVEGPGSKFAFLGTSPSEDLHDPEWTSNTRNGFALQFFEGNRLTYPHDPMIEKEDFTFEVSIFPYNVNHERAVFSFEDSDNEINGLFIVDGKLETRWRGGKKLHEGREIEYGNWYDISVIWSPPCEEIYVNGLLIDRNVWEFFDPSISDLREINFGLLADGSGYRFPFLGIMDGISLSEKVCEPGGILGSWNFQESSPDSPFIHDRSGYNNNGIYRNPSDPSDSIELANGVYGNCLDISQSRSLMDCGHMRNITSSTGLEWSISMWLRAEGISDGKSSNNITNTFLAYSSPSSNDMDPLEIGLDGDLHMIYHLAAGVDPRIVLSGRSDFSLSPHIWNHLFISLGEIDGVWTLKLNLDGNEFFFNEVSLPGPIIIGDDENFNFTIGGSLAATPSYFTGKIDEVSIMSSSVNPFPGKNTSLYLFDSDASDRSMFMDRDLKANNIDFTSSEMRFGTGSGYLNGFSSFFYHDQPEDFLSGTFSAGMWVHPLSIDDGDVLIRISDGKGNDTLSLEIENDGSVHLSAFMMGKSIGNFFNVSSRSRIEIGRWSHVSFSCGNGEILLVLNGVVDNSTRKGLEERRILPGSGEQLLLIGAASGVTDTNHFHGYIDRMVISEHVTGPSIDTDGDGMSDSYEVMRSADSAVFDPLECNGRYAILVGNNDNRSDKNVGYASANDVRDIRYHLRSLGWADCDITVLFHSRNIMASSYGNLSYLDGGPSRSEVIDSLRRLATMSSLSDLVMFLYSGHGDQISDDDEDEDYCDFSAAGKNMSRQDEQFALSEGLDKDPHQLSDDDYTDLVMDIKAKQMIHIIISCNSGGFLEDIRQEYEESEEKPWKMYSIITACHENDVAYVKNRESSFLAQSMFDQAMMKTDRGQWDDRKAFGRVDWDPDIDVTINNMRFMEQDGGSGDLPTRMDDPPHWQRNHYTEEGYLPGFENGKKGQDFPDSVFQWGKTDRATMYVSMLDYSPSNGNGIVDLEEAFYFSVHNEYLGEGNTNPEADPHASTDLGDDPLIFDSDSDKSSKVYL